MRTLTNPKDGDTITTELTDDEALERLSKMTDDEFAQSLVDGHERTGRLSACQWYWAHKKCLKRDEPRSLQLREGTFSKLYAMLSQAKDHIQFPKIILRTPSGAVRWWLHQDGFVGIKCGEAHVGKVTTDDVFHIYRSCKPRTVELMKVIQVDPVAAFALWGRETGFCCFCNHEIETDESLAVGYGPVCADRYGLPWG
jgi:hypothetical protein